MSAYTLVLLGLYLRYSGVSWILIIFLNIGNIFSKFMKNITVSEHEEISVENIYVLDRTDTNNTD